MDGGQLGAPELTMQEAREQILEAHHMEKGRRLLQDYDAAVSYTHLDVYKRQPNPPALSRAFLR